DVFHQWFPHLRRRPRVGNAAARYNPRLGGIRPDGDWTYPGRGATTAQRCHGDVHVLSPYEGSLGVLSRLDPGSRCDMVGGADPVPHLSRLATEARRSMDTAG